jgi:serine/threonine-protein kinase PpkA
MTRLLVVDDDVIVRTLLAQRLRAAGYLVETAADGRAGLALARRFTPAVLLTDRMMPEMDGPALVEALRAEPALAQTYVILLAGQDSASTGADDWLAKPWTDAALLACVAKAAQGRATGRPEPVAAGRG